MKCAPSTSWTRLTGGRKGRRKGRWKGRKQGRMDGCKYVRKLKKRKEGRMDVS